MTVAIGIWLVLLLFVFVLFAFMRLPLWTRTAAYALALIVPLFVPIAAPNTLMFIWVFFVVLFGALQVIPLRRQLLSRPMLAVFRKLMPRISKTEKEALEAGTTWWDGELFSGNPDWRKITGLASTRLTREEQVFIDGPVEELCDMLDEWRITQNDNDLPPKAWEFLKQKGFFGMIIPRKYGGLEFSPLAHSAVIVKLASKSITAAVTAMVPNSLGPGQLLLRYGTEGQKEYYLPRLASGEDIPCFALTSAIAGSDAASMQDTGVVCRDEFGGRKEVLGVRLNWNKRYITLAPVATLLGLAFKMYDPEHLLGEQEELGITLALVPTNIPGVEVGRRHLPLDQAFMNGPTRGKDVFVPVDYIIGGREFAGQGWRMLMECLADGRSVSLPALAAGLGKLATRATTGYARIRKQFRVPLARFEGVEEALARIVGNTYAIEAVREMTAQALDKGEKPSVVSAIAKYHCTERMRTILNDAMDVFGGTAICMGPKNLLGRYYESIPISITVEGANILTRSLIIFGQGIVRCHPYLLAEMEAVQNINKTRGLRDFDRALFSHAGFVVSNIVRTFLLAFTEGHLARIVVKGYGRRYARQIVRMSSVLAFVSDFTLMLLGGALKRKENLSARLGDVLSQLYIASAAIKRFGDQGRVAEDRVLLDWVCRDSLHIAQEKLADFLDNFPNRFFAWFMRFIIFPNGRTFLSPDDRLGRRVVKIMLEPTDARKRLTEGIFISDDPEDPLGRIENAFNKAIAAADAEAKIRKAIKTGKVQSRDEKGAIDEAFKSGIITKGEAEKMHEAYQAMLKAIEVDAFEAGEFNENK
jgi:acyl-CoA dehydrogenase